MKTTAPLFEIEDRVVLSDVAVLGDAATTWLRGNHARLPHDAVPLARGSRPRSGEACTGDQSGPAPARVDDGRRTFARAAHNRSGRHRRRHLRESNEATRSPWSRSPPEPHLFGADALSGAPPRNPVWRARARGPLQSFSPSASGASKATMGSPLPKVNQRSAGINAVQPRRETAPQSHAGPECVAPSATSCDAHAGRSIT